MSIAPDEAGPFSECPVGSRWQSVFAVSTVRVIRHTHGRDGRPLVLVETEGGMHSRNYWHPAALTRNRIRLDP